MPVGAVLEVVLFAFALAHRFNAQRYEYIKAQQKALQLQRLAKQNLEITVAERTQTLQRTLQELETANQRLQSLSTLDGLTGIKNRRYFDEKLAAEWQLALRNVAPLSLLLLDIDYFKQFNDQFGHLAGDECLKQVADMISRTATRPADEAARYGGEEFALILPATELSGALHVAEAIRKAIESTTFYVDQRAHRVTVSIGAACFERVDGRYPSDLIGAADEALYAAKISGRNRVVSFNAEREALLGRR
jgi:diguanylate cyclase (GGDEF)-like protein